MINQIKESILIAAIILLAYSYYMKNKYVNRLENELMLTLNNAKNHALLLNRISDNYLKNLQFIENTLNTLELTNESIMRLNNALTNLQNLIRTVINSYEKNQNINLESIKNCITIFNSKLLELNDLATLVNIETVTKLSTNSSDILNKMEELVNEALNRRPLLINNGIQQKNHLYDSPIHNKMILEELAEESIPNCKSSFY